MHGLKRLRTCRERSKQLARPKKKNGIVHDRSCSCACHRLFLKKYGKPAWPPKTIAVTISWKYCQKIPRVSEWGRGPESTEDHCKVVKKAHGASCHDSSNNAFFTLYQTEQWSQIWCCILPNARSQTCLGGGEARQTLKMIRARTLNTALDLHEYWMSVDSTVLYISIFLLLGHNGIHVTGMRLRAGLWLTCEQVEPLRRLAQIHPSGKDRNSERGQKMDIK